MVNILFLLSCQLLLQHARTSFLSHTLLLAYACTHTPLHVHPSHKHAHMIQCYCRYRVFSFYSFAGFTLFNKTCYTSPFKKKKIFVVLRTSNGEVVAQTAENDIYSTGLGRRSRLGGRPSCHGLGLSPDVCETSPSSRHFFSRAKKAQSKFLLSFFSFFIFPSSFWRRVPRLAPSYRTILVKQILNQ